MRNMFGRGFDGIHRGSDMDLQLDALAASPDQVAAVWNAAGEVVVASPVPYAPPGSFDMDITRYPGDHDLSTVINSQRTRSLDLPPLSTSTRYLTTATDYSERTRILALDGERLQLDDIELQEWLIDAEKDMVLGTDNHPVFETSLEQTACCIRRLPNGRVAMTEIPRAHIKTLQMRLRMLAGGRPDSKVSICIETPIRCAARYFLTATREGVDTMRPGKGTEVTAFLLMGVAGYSFGLWSPQAGLFSEHAFLAPDSVSRKRPTRRPAQSADDYGADPNVDLRLYVTQAFDQLLLQMSADNLDDLQLSNYSQVVWGADRDIHEIGIPIAEACAEKTGLEFIAMDVPSDEAAAAGLLLGSYKFGQPSVPGAATVAQVNLAHDLLAMEDTEEIERLREEESRSQGRKARTVMTILAPPIVVAAFLVAYVLSLVVSGFITAWKDANADARAAEMKPAVDRRKSYEANLKWYQEFIGEVSRLRQQQPTGLGLFRQLNANYPMALDPSFFVSELKLTKLGELQLTGLSRNKDAVADFIKQLEFAGGSDSGSRLFSDLAYEVRDAAAPAIQPASQIRTGGLGTLAAGQPSASGVIAWRVSGTYVPAAKFAPKPSPTPAPGAPAAAPPTAPKTTP